MSEIADMNSLMEVEAMIERFLNDISCELFDLGATVDEFLHENRESLTHLPKKGMLTRLRKDIRLLEHRINEHLTAIR